MKILLIPFLTSSFLFPIFAWSNTSSSCSLPKVLGLGEKFPIKNNAVVVTHATKAYHHSECSNEAFSKFLDKKKKEGHQIISLSDEYDFENDKLFNPPPSNFISVCGHQRIGLSVAGGHLLIPSTEKHFSFYSIGGYLGRCQSSTMVDMIFNFFNQKPGALSLSVHIPIIASYTPFSHSKAKEVRNLGSRSTEKLNTLIQLAQNNDVRGLYEFHGSQLDPLLSQITGDEKLPSGYPDGDNLFLIHQAIGTQSFMSLASLDTLAQIISPVHLDDLRGFSFQVFLDNNLFSKFELGSPSKKRTVNFYFSTPKSGDIPQSCEITSAPDKRS